MSAIQLNYALMGNQELPKCHANHALIWVTDRQYQCDICYKSGFTNGGWYCSQECSYDLCKECFTGKLGKGGGEEKSGGNSEEVESIKQKWLQSV